MGGSPSKSPEAPEDLNKSNTRTSFDQLSSSTVLKPKVNVRTNSPVRYNYTRPRTPSPVRPVNIETPLVRQTVATKSIRVTPTSISSQSKSTVRSRVPTLPRTGFTASQAVNASSSSTTLPPKPSPPVIGHQVVIHDANNYLLKASKSESNDLRHVSVPIGKIVDKFFLYVCPQYNSKEGCSAPICRRFHVCYYWVLDKCRNDNCSYNHTIEDFQNILSKLQRRGVNSPPIEVLRNNHNYNRKSKRESKTVLCVFSLMGNCRQQNQCSHMHSKKPYLWQVKKDDMWLSLSYGQSDALEESFCQPEQKVVDLLPVPKIKNLENLRTLLQPSLNWKVDFQDMKVYCDFLALALRRVSTVSDICCHKSMYRVATRWIWYWQSDEENWTPYSDGSIKRFYNVALSDQLEHQYHFSEERELEVIIGNYAYTIDLDNMKQVNKNLGTVRKIRRRPVYNVRQNRDLYFYQFFSTVSEDCGVQRQLVPSASSEFVFVRNLMVASINDVRLVSVERVINNYHWNAYQNKKELLKNLYKKDVQLINEQYLFHGTKHSVVDQICNDNFDYRLYGTNVGNAYGRGVYFSNEASLSSQYSETDSSGIKVMFVAYVLVGTMAVGNGFMTLPPMYEKTNKNFDTTCDCACNSRIFVKYNRDEYYPAYVVRFRG